MGSKKAVIRSFPWRSMSVNNCNTYFIEGSPNILIDPGHTRLFSHVRDELKEVGLSLDDIGVVVCTHAHPDHIEAIEQLKNHGVMMAMHEAEWHFANAMDSAIVQAFGISLKDYEPDFLLKEGDLSIGDVKFRVLHTPGHSPGSICLYIEENQALFTGDLIFNGGFGRMDLPGGDGVKLFESIHRLATLDVHEMYPGHGETLSGKDAYIQNLRQIEYSNPSAQNSFI